MGLTVTHGGIVQPARLVYAFRFSFLVKKNKTICTGRFWFNKLYPIYNEEERSEDTSEVISFFVFLVCLFFTVIQCFPLQMILLTITSEKIKARISEFLSIWFVHLML